MIPRSDPSIEAGVLHIFAKELDALVKTPANVEKMIGIMEKILAGDSIQSMQIPQEEGALASRVATLKNMIGRPSLDRVNIFAVGTLSGKMQGMLADKVYQLKTLQACKEFCQGMLPELSPDGIQILITVVEGCYRKALSENLSPEKALSSALAKGMVSSFIGELDINKNTALRRALESKEELKDYICIFTGNLVGSDAVVLYKEGGNNSPQRYHRSEIEKWITDHPTDPMNNESRTEANILPDPQAEKVIKNASRSWIDSKMKDVPSSFEVRVLMNKGILLAVAAAYPQLKERYETILEGSRDTERAIEEAGALTEEMMSQVVSLTERVGAYVEQAPFPCYPYLKEFIKQAVEKVKPGVPLEGVKFALEGKIDVFIHFFHRIDFAPLLSPISKEEALKIVGEAISKEIPLDQVEALFSEYVDSALIEKRVRKECPGRVMGTKEWRCLGVVGKTPPLTEKIIAALHETSPSDPAKEAWQTGILVLVPEIVDGKPLTLNRLGELMKKDFPETDAGYRCMDLPADYANNPVGKSHWVLIEKDVLPGSMDKNFQEQEAMIKAPYELPELLPMTVGIILNYLNSDPENRERLFRNKPMTYTRCKEMIEGHHVVIGGFAFEGFRISYNNYDCDFNGMGAQRNLGP